LANKQQTLSVGENMHYQRTTILIFFLMLMPASSTIAFSDPVKKSGTAGTILLSKKYAEFNEPWGMAFLPRGDILVTEKKGNLLLVSADGLSKVSVGGLPKVAYGGQGGLGDVILHPDYNINKLVYISYAEQG
jgi:glucose/arabinose dehydrogenase